jgi:DNA-binding SARP family transcriptional activator
MFIPGVGDVAAETSRPQGLPGVRSSPPRLCGGLRLVLSPLTSIFVCAIMMEFRVLGPLEVVEHGSSLALGGGKQRALLAILLLHANEVVGTDRLIDELWGEAPPVTVAKSIQVYVSRLRKELGEERVVTRPPGYLLRVEPRELDLKRFEALLAEARDGDGDAATTARTLREALALWRGPALADLAYERFAQVEIGRLEELRWAALEARVDAELACGRHAELVGELQALVAEHPLRERVHGQLMLALYRCARQADALEAYRDARGRLLGELGLEPGEGAQEPRGGHPAPGPRARPCGG